jgi:hypothetical protein
MTCDGRTDWRKSRAGAVSSPLQDDNQQLRL